MEESANDITSLNAATNPSAYLIVGRPFNQPIEINGVFAHLSYSNSCHIGPVVSRRSTLLPLVQSLLDIPEVCQKSKQSLHFEGLLPRLAPFLDLHLLP